MEALTGAQLAELAGVSEAEIGRMVDLGVLVAILYYFPVAQVHFFALTPPTAAGGMAGHWIYGA
ncbi:MAG TPA: hypothetical protein VFQ04_17135, partial [Actinomycetes bacterium]|nr:hypothetical protein [Actinomycetes bacterium]